MTSRADLYHLEDQETGIDTSRTCSPKNQKLGTNEPNNVSAPSISETHKLSDPALLLCYRALAVYGEQVSIALLARFLRCDMDQARSAGGALEKLGFAIVVGPGFTAVTFPNRKPLSPIPFGDRRSIAQSWIAVLKSQRSQPTRKMVDLALRACLWDDAALGIESLIRKRVARYDYETAVDLYRDLEKCRRKTFESISDEQQVRHAQALVKIGRWREGEKLLRSVISAAGKDTSRSLASTALIQLDRSLPGQRLTLIQNRIGSWKSEGSSKLYSLYTMLSAAHTSNGNFAEAGNALVQAKDCLDSEPSREPYSLLAASGYLMVNQGRFEEALGIFQSVSAPRSAEAAVLTNVAICMEHLGRVREAVETQSRAHRQAMKMGLRWGEACALSNLATFKTKLGALSEAERLFRQAKATAKTYPGNRGGILHGIEGEEGPFKAVLGDYRQALAQLIRAARCRLLFQNERLQFQISLCNVLIDLGRTRAPTRLLGRIHQATHGSRLTVVQFAFVASRTEKDPAVATGLLREAITIAHDSKLIYEECKLKLEYCRRTITGNLPDTCSAELLEAESIARANGYIPQQIDALVLRGALAPSLIISKELYSEAFLLSRHCGSSLVQAYIAYALANTLECGSHFVPARRWYLRSCSLISRITEGVSGSLKRSFLLSHKWASACIGKIRKSAVATDNPSFDLPSELTGKASIYFRTLHEVSELSHLKDSPLEFLSEVANIIALLTSWDAFVMEYGKPDPQIKKSIGKSGRHTTESVDFIGIDSAQHFDHLPWRRRDSMWLPCGSHTPRVGLYLKFKKAASETDGQFLSVLQRVLEEGLSTVAAKTTFVDRAADARWGDLVGSSDAFAQLCKEILRASAHAANVLIQGETGTGKELVAKAIHDRSQRRIKRFVPVDCGAIPDGLFESEIFGIRRGSFTGSDRDRKGLAEEADGGTLFLDEIANLSLQSQAKLLRFVQEKAIRRLGSTAEHALDVRILAASNVPLSRLVSEGQFREDLYFRLSTVVIHVPPLSSRTADVVPLAEHFLHSLNALNKTNKSFGVKTLSELSRRHFPGNVRELRNLVERCFYSSDARILELPGEAREQQPRNIEGWFREVTTGNRSFWSSIYVDYRQRRISRQDMRSLIDHGLRVTNGYYKALAKRFNITVSEYRRFMDFLRRNDCLLDFRPYRRS